MALEPQVCRLCIVPIDSTGAITLNYNVDLTDSILHITSVEAVLNPEHCVFMCDKCHSLLEHCIQFRSMCLQNDNMYRKMYAKMCAEPASPSALGYSLSDSSEFVQCKMEEDERVDEYASDDDAQEEATQEEEASDEEKPQLDVSVDEKPVLGETTPKKSRKYRKREKKPEDDASRKVQCQVCGSFLFRANLSKHLQTHEENRPKFQCTECPKGYTEKRKLKEHIKIIHTKEQEFSCDRCGRTFKRIEALKTHFLSKHTDIKKYPCKSCDQKFSTASARLYHDRTVHMTARPYSCQYCSKTFKMRGDFTIHLRTHTGEKPFKCDLCDKRFCKSYNVVIHKKSHRNDELQRQEKILAEYATPVSIL